MFLPADRTRHAQNYRSPQRWTIAWVWVLIIVLSACNRTPASPTPVAPPTRPAGLPDRQASAVVHPETGGVITLSNGAEIAVPRDAVSAAAVVSLRMVDKAPPAPLPRSLIGRAYDVTVEEAQLTGVALVTLPLPPEVINEQYDVAPYVWNGRSWERRTGRLTTDGIRFGLDQPARVAVLGEWRMADASLSLIMPPVDPARPTTPIEVKGQYRYSAPPAKSHEYTEARLELKWDSSGGAGRIAGDETLDQTIGQTALWFQPDAGQAEGQIDFNHVFEILPGSLNVPFGTASRFYAVLTVSDSAAPTRRVSSSAEYAQIVPIRVDGSDITRPELAGGQDIDLRWHVRLNGETLFRRPASDTKLSLAEALAQGGLGEYKITLETEYEGRAVPVSNEITVQLALPVTSVPTPPPGQSLARAATSTPTPPMTVIPGLGAMPATPTRRVPAAISTLTPTPTPTLAPSAPTTTATATRPAWAITFWADAYTLESGKCTKVHWKVENVQAVYFNGTPTTGIETREVCPTAVTTYKLRTVDQGGKEETRTITISVQSTEETEIEFVTDNYQLAQDECATISWRVSGATAVYLKMGTAAEEGVVGEGTRKDCPEATTTYVLRVERGQGNVTRTLVIEVVAEDEIPITFWADRYALEVNGCTTLYWSVDAVDSVYLKMPGKEEEGVPGVGSRDQVCPTGNQQYALRVLATDDTEDTKILELQTTFNWSNTSEVIAQGVVREVTYVTDIDSVLAGEQPGWRLQVDGVNKLFGAGGSCCDAAVMLELTQAQSISPHPIHLDWPINPDQLVEFRAPCTANFCKINPIPKSYLKLRSP